MSLMYRLINKNPDMKIGLITTSNLLDKFNRILKQLNLKNKLTFVRAGKAIEEARKSNSHYDIILVDEAHRLQRYYPKGHPESKNISTRVSLRLTKSTCFKKSQMDSFSSMTSSRVYVHKMFLGLTSSSSPKDM